MTDENAAMKPAFELVDTKNPKRFLRIWASGSIECSEPGLENMTIINRIPYIEPPKSHTVTEAELKAKAVAPRVTLEHIESLIVGEEYINAAHDRYNDDPIFQKLYCLTLCVLVLKNGFTVTGESACASPENYNEDIGKRLARENAVRKIWQLEGYLLRQKLYEATAPLELEGSPVAQSGPPAAERT